MPMFQPAVKERLHARVALDGPTGSGKTWTALQWARIIAGPDNPIGVIDTENRSAAYYAPAPGVEVERVNWWDPPYEFGHFPVSPPYDPRQLRDLIRAAAAELGEGGVLVIDSLTHYWTGEGGTLDIVDNAAARTGNSFTGWKEGTPAQRVMLDAIIHAPFHVIATMRSKMEYVLEESDRGGRKVQVPKKVGMAPEQRAGVEYEFTVVADMELDHKLIVSKSRCDVISDMVAPQGRSADVAQAFAAWLAVGVERVGEADRQGILNRFRAMPEDARRAEWDAFVGVFGRLADLTPDRLAAVNEWLDARLPGAAPTAASPATAEPEPTDPPSAPRAVKKAASRGGEPKPVGAALGEALAGATESPTRAN